MCQTSESLVISRCYFLQNRHFSMHLRLQEGSKATLQTLSVLEERWTERASPRDQPFSAAATNIKWICLYRPQRSLLLSETNSNTGRWWLFTSTLLSRLEGERKKGKSRLEQSTKIKEASRINHKKDKNILNKTSIGKSTKLAETVAANPHQV